MRASLLKKSTPKTKLATAARMRSWIRRWSRVGVYTWYILAKLSSMLAMMTCPRWNALSAPPARRSSMSGGRGSYRTRLWVYPERLELNSDQRSRHIECDYILLVNRDPWALACAMLGRAPPAAYS